MRSTARNAMLALILSVYGCDNPGQPSEPDRPAPTVSVQAVRVTPQSVQLLAIGETRQLRATVFPVNATDQAIVWESSDSGVASVSAAGLVTAKAAGVGVFITASTRDGGHQASVNVSVNP
jgi:Bacterial surface proteins containing Ig-like domains